MIDPKRLRLAALLMLALAGCAAPAERDAPEPAPAAPAPQPDVGGAAMDPAATILDNLSKSADHTTLVAAIRASGLADRLSGSAPHTLFAPTNAAFARLPEGTMAALMEPSNRRLLAQVLGYHVVSGARTRSAIAAEARSSGAAAYRTVEGSSIRVSAEGERMTVTDVHGNRSAVTIADVRQSNGVFHVVDAVLLPVT